LRRFGWLPQRAGPPCESREELLAIDPPGIVERESRPTGRLQSIQVEAQQVALPGATVVDGEPGRDRIGKVAAPVSLARALPVVETHLAVGGDVPVLEMHIGMDERS